MIDVITVDAQGEYGNGQEVASFINPADCGTQKVCFVLESGHDVPEHGVEDNCPKRVIERWRQVQVVGEVLDKIGDFVWGHLLLVGRSRG